MYSSIADRAYLSSSNANSVKEVEIMTPRSYDNRLPRVWNSEEDYPDFSLLRSHDLYRLARAFGLRPDGALLLWFPVDDKAMCGFRVALRKAVIERYNLAMPVN